MLGYLALVFRCVENSICLSGNKVDNFDKTETAFGLRCVENSICLSGNKVDNFDKTETAFGLRCVLNPSKSND